MEDIFCDINEKDLKKLLKTFGNNEYFRKLLLDELYTEEHHELLMRCGFIYTVEEIINIIENGCFERCYGYMYNWKYYDSGINLFNKMIKMVEDQIKKDIKLLNLLMKNCSNESSDYIYKILQTVKPNKETLKLFLKHHRIDCPIGNKIFKKIIEYKIKPTDELLQIILTRACIPNDFIIYIINTYNLEIKRDDFYKKVDFMSDNSKILIYLYERDKIITYNDINYLSKCGTTHLDAIKYLISKNIIPDYKCLINTIKAGYESPFDIILENITDIKEGQNELTDVIQEYGRYEDVYIDHYLPLMVNKGFEITEDINIVIENKN